MGPVLNGEPRQNRDIVRAAPAAAGTTHPILSRRGYRDIGHAGCGDLCQWGEFQRLL